MQRILLFCGIWLAVLCPSYAQQTNVALPQPSVEIADGMETSFADQMDFIFGQLDFSEVTSGVLLDRSFPFTELSLYDGREIPEADRAAHQLNWAKWKRVYATLFSGLVRDIELSSYIPSNEPPGPPVPTPYDDDVPIAVPPIDPGTEIRKMRYGSLEKIVKNTTQGDTIPVAVIHFETHYIDSLALTDNRLQVTGERLQDVPSRTDSPYLSRRVLAAAITQKVLPQRTYFHFPVSLFFENYPPNVSGLIFTVQEGTETTTHRMSLGGTVAVDFTSGGEKQFSLQLMQGGFPTGLITYFSATVEAPASPTTFRYSSAAPDVIWDLNAASGYEDEEGHFKAATGKAYISYGCGNGQLTKPLIVLQGFTPQGFEEFEVTYGDFISRLSTDYPFSTLKEDLENAGYDLIYLEYDNGTDYIQRNAFLLEALINRVNNAKISNEPIMMIGISMGGLVARYALAGMEARFKDHEVDTFISFDTPHQGANVPLGFQYMLKQIAGTKIQTRVLGILIDEIDLSSTDPNLTLSVDLLESPAARQMLRYQALELNSFPLVFEDRSLYSTFQAELRNTGLPDANGVRNGYPKQCKVMAIASGSQIAEGQGFAPYAELLGVRGPNIFVMPE
ncbi:MAG: hypothetical protein AAF734_03885, partial [Bacteroidota bacterium]